MFHLRCKLSARANAISVVDFLLAPSENPGPRPLATTGIWAAGVTIDPDRIAIALRPVGVLPTRP